MAETTVAERIAAALERGDAEGVAALYAEDAVTYHPLFPEGVRGRDAIRQSEQELLDAFSDVRVEVRYVLADESRCMAEVVIRATNTGDLDLGGAEPVPATGRRIELPSVWSLELDQDGKVATERTYLDTGTLMSQLGLAEEG